jgi:hypothetical protein
MKINNKKYNDWNWKIKRKKDKRALFLEKREKQMIVSDKPLIIRHYTSCHHEKDRGF